MLTNWSGLQLPIVFDSLRCYRPSADELAEERYLWRTVLLPYRRLSRLSVYSLDIRKSPNKPYQFPFIRSMPVTRSTLKVDTFPPFLPGFVSRQKKWA